MEIASNELKDMESMKTKTPHMLKPIEKRFMHISRHYSSFNLRLHT
jgi:hypothetical protein